MQALIINILKAVEAGRAALAQYNEAIKAARPALKGKSEDAVRETIKPILSAFYAVPLIEGQRKAKGTKVFDSTAPQYEAAKAALRKVTEDLMGSGSDKADKPKADQYEIPAELLKAAQALVELAQQYGDDAKVHRALAAQAVALAFTK